MSPGRSAALGISCLLRELAWPVRIPTSSFTAREIWSSSDRALAELLHLNGYESGVIAGLRRSFSLREESRRIDEAGIELACLTDPDYPASVARIHDPPPVLFILGGAGGNRQEFLARRRIAIVGSRAASRYGLDVAGALAAGVARYAVCVVSGLALGIDAAAHRGALEEERGGTIAVLGCGLDTVYPKANRQLQRRILKSGLLISEYPPRTEPLPWRFPARNRIIAGMSEAVVVVEARRKSGALITADFAMEQGADVCAVPGSIFSPLSAGPHGLIRAGAVPVTGPDDILECLGIEKQPARGRKRRKQQPVKLDGDEHAVFQAMDGEFRHPDELALRAGVTSAQAAGALVMLELKGLARHDEGRGFSR